MEQPSLIVSFKPAMILQSFYAIFIYILTKRMKISPILPLILSFIPVFGLLYFMYFSFYKVFKVIFDRLEQLELGK